MTDIQLIKDLSQSPHHSHHSPNLFGDIKILCPQGQPGYAYCLECENCCVVCKNEEDCSCYLNHKGCENIKRITMFNGNLQNNTRSPKILNQITLLSQDMIDNISQLENEIKHKFLIFGLCKADIEMVHKIRKYANEQAPLVSKDLRKYKEEYAKSEKEWFVNEVKNFQVLIEKSLKFIREKFDKITSIIYYEHMQNSKNPSQIVFDNSNTLKGDEKIRIRMLEMLADLGKLSKAQKIFSAKEHEFTLGKFYEKCINRKNLLYLVKNSTDLIYGAYSPIVISDVLGKQYNDNQKKTFIFDLSENEKSRATRTEKILRTFPYYDKKQNNPDQYIIWFGEGDSNPNLIVSQDCLSVQKYNYIWFGSKDQNSVFFQKRPSKMYDSSSKLKYTLKEFQVFQLTFK